ncbi:MAG: efflux RND transporter periplasmic adaptor subunit [Planctomycetota bacterium]
MAVLDLKDLDRILDGLESDARSMDSDAEFYQRLLGHLQQILGALSSFYAVPFKGDKWLQVARVGDEDSVSQICASLAGAEFGQDFRYSGMLKTEQWLAVPIRNGTAKRGVLVATLRGASEFPLDGLAEILDAFAEIIQLRQVRMLESLADGALSDAGELCEILGESEDCVDASTHLANGLLNTLHANRVSVVSSSVTGPKLLAASGVAIADKKSKTTRALLSLGANTLRQSKPIIERPKAAQTSESAMMDDDGVFLWRCGLPFGKTQYGHDALILEFKNEESLVTGLLLLNFVFPQLETSWKQTARWQRLPKGLRAIGNGVGQQFGLVASIRYFVLFALLLAIAVWLFSENEFNIEASGVHEPAIQKTVFTTGEGYVEKLFVRDGQEVEVGQKLVQLRSPQLQLKIEQLQGEKRSLAEEENSTRVALGQLTSTVDDWQLQQAKLTAKVELLVLKQKNTQSQLDILKQRKSELLLHAPIAGQVVAKELVQQMEDKPVRLGEPMLKIVALEGPWQIRLRIQERDRSFVEQFYQLPLDGQTSMPLEFVFDSRNSIRHPAELTWMAEQVENLDSIGCFVEAHAKTDLESLSNRNTGASVHAFFACGEKPNWYLWFRPIVELLERKQWISTEQHDDLPE